MSLCLHPGILTGCDETGDVISCSDRAVKLDTGGV